MSGASSISPDSSTNVLLLKKAIYLLQQGNGYRPCHLPPSDVIFIIQRNKHQSIPFQIIDLLLYLRIFHGVCSLNYTASSCISSHSISPTHPLDASADNYDYIGTLAPSA
eukprot:192544_1